MQGISNPPGCKSFEYHRLPFTFISTLPMYLMKKYICFDTYLEIYQTVFPFLSLHATAYLSSARGDGSSSLLAFKISLIFLIFPKALKKLKPTNPRLDFKFYIITSGFSSFKFAIIVPIDGSILYLFL